MFTSIVIRNVLCVLSPSNTHQSHTVTEQSLFQCVNSMPTPEAYPLTVLLALVE